MNLYRRLIIALGLAALGGATALAVVMQVPWAPALTWAMLVGILTTTAMGLGYWVLKPLRALATDPETSQQADIHDFVYHLKNELETLRSQNDAEDPDGNAQAEAQTWRRANQALSVLFSSVTRDTLSQPCRDYFTPQLAEWTDEGLATVAAILWHGKQADSVSAQPDCPTKMVPDELCSTCRIGNQPILKVIGDLTWARFPIPNGHAPSASHPLALVMAWELDSPPGEQVLAGFSGLAHYMGLRARAMAETDQTAPPHQNHIDPRIDQPDVRHIDHHDDYHDASAAAVALKAEFLADTNQRLQRSVAAISELAGIISQQLTSPAETTAQTAEQTSAILDRGQETLERLSQLLDLTTSNWQPSTKPTLTLSVADLSETIAQRHRHHPGVHLDIWSANATDPVHTDPAPLSLALDTLLAEMARCYPGRIGLTVQNRSVNGVVSGEIIVESDNTSSDDSNATSLGMALVNRLATCRGGKLTHQQTTEGQRLTLSWPYATAPTGSQHEKAA